MINLKNLSFSSYPVLSILVLGLMIRTIIALFLYPGYDEAYYYLYSYNLDWSYFDHPLFVALTTGIGIWLTGEVNQFTIRIGTLITSTASLYLLYLTGRKLFGCQSALFSLIIASLIPIFTVAIGVLTLPDVPLIFFWTLTLYYATEEFIIPFNSNKNHRQDACFTGYKPSYRLVIICICIGLACLSKYHGFILGLGLVGFCLFNPPYRKVFTSNWLILGVICFIITLFPLLYWNWQNDWVSFGFQLSGRFQSENPTPININLLNILITALAGIGYLFPSFGFPLWWISGKSIWLKGKKEIPQGRQETTLRLSPLTRREEDNRQQEFLKYSNYDFVDSILVNDDDNQQLNQSTNYGYRLILWVSLPLTIGFTLLGAVTQILPTWSMPGFWGLTLILGDYTSRWFKYRRKIVYRWLYLSFLFINTLFLIILLHFQIGLLQKPNENIFFNGIVAPQNDPSTELIDIVQLRELLGESTEFNQALSQADFIFTNQYYLGGYIGMAIAPLTNIPVTCFSNDSRGFDYWYPQKEELRGKNGIYITTERFAEDEATGIKYKEYFKKWDKVTQISLKRSGEVTETFNIYLGQNLDVIRTTNYEL